MSLFVCLLLVAACSRGPSASQSASPRTGAPQPAPAPQPAATPGDAGRPKIVVLGDSLTAGLGLAESQAYPALLQQKLNADGYELGRGQRGHLRRYLGGGTAAPRLGAGPGRRAHPDSRAGRERRPARAAGRRDEEEPRGDHHAAQQRRHRRAAGRHGSAAELRSGIHRIFPTGLPRSRRRVQRDPPSVSPRQGRGQRRR